MQTPLLALALAAGSAFLSYFLRLRLRLTVALLVVGLIATGAVTFSVSSIAFETFLVIVAFGFPMIAGSAALGIAAGLELRKKRWVIGILLLMPFPLFVWKSHYDGMKAANEASLALDFVKGNSQLRELVGGEIKVYPGSATTYDGSTRGRYEYSLIGRDMFAIVDVNRTGDTPRFTLACVTTLTPGQRDSSKDDCRQSSVELPPLR